MNSDLPNLDTFLSHTHYNSCSSLCLICSIPFHSLNIRRCCLNIFRLRMSLLRMSRCSDCTVPYMPYIYCCLLHMSNSLPRLCLSYNSFVPSHLYTFRSHNLYNCSVLLYLGIFLSHTLYNLSLYLFRSYNILSHILNMFRKYSYTVRFHKMLRLQYIRIENFHANQHQTNYNLNDIRYYRYHIHYTIQRLLYSYSSLHRSVANKHLACHYPTFHQWKKKHNIR